jgi:hypothetical protein
MHLYDPHLHVLKGLRNHRWQEVAREHQKKEKELGWIGYIMQRKATAEPTEG